VQKTVIVSNKYTGEILKKSLKENTKNHIHYKNKVLLIFALLIIFNGCSVNSKRDMTVEKNVSVVKRYIDEMNKRNENYLNDYFAANYVYHGPNGDLDLEGFKKFHHTTLSKFPDAVMKAEDIIACGDKVVTRWSLRGTIKGTGREVTIKGIIISRFKNGKVVEEWEQAHPSPPQGDKR
jgi:predicted ester cyclase